MVDNPRDAAGEPIFFPGARAPDVEAHRAATFAHVLRMVELDPSYARWTAGTMARDNPDWHADLLDRFDAELVRLNIPRPRPFEDVACKLPELKKGRRGLPKHRFFHETL